MRDKKQKQHLRKLDRQQRKSRREAGLCSDCGKLCSSGMSACDFCSATRQRRRQRVYRPLSSSSQGCEEGIRHHGESRGGVSCSACPAGEEFTAASATTS